MNKHDSERIAGVFESHGHVAVSDLAQAEIVVFVTCCVRETADVRLAGQLDASKNIPLPENSALKKRIISVGGCIGQRDQEKLLEQHKHLDIVFGTHNIDELYGLVEDAKSNQSQRCKVKENSDIV